MGANNIIIINRMAQNYWGGEGAESAEELNS